MSELAVLPVLFLLVLFKLHFSLALLTIDAYRNGSYYHLPRFWTNTGFCPFGEITNAAISNSLLSEDVKINLELIGALPNKAVSNIRVHWLLELVDFIKFENHGIPLYNFEKLDKFIDAVDKAELSVGFEFMGTPNDVFDFKNISSEFIWEDLVFQIVQRYLEFYGVDKVLKWNFESWNEPDLKTYNKLNFSVAEYLNYLDSIRRGLTAAARTVRNVKFQLRGPAGLFKNREHHPLCWSILERCSKNAGCPLDILTFHRKGTGGADEVVSGTYDLLRKIAVLYPKLAKMKISNNEADPISGWSTARPFQSDTRYAIILASIIFKYWNTILNVKEFEHFESISHDNAFLSYHPHEFDQRTVLARFQMNLTNPPHTQFIQKPVYACLGMLGNLGKFAQDIEHFPDENITLFASASHSTAPLYLSYVLIKDQGARTQFVINLNTPGVSSRTEVFSYIIEAIEDGTTDPVKVWNFYGKPSYPNSTVRQEMRRAQGPRLVTTGITKSTTNITLSLRVPFLILFRMCSSAIERPFKPYNLRLKNITYGEVFLVWKDIYRPERCLKTYEVYFSKYSKDDWKLISEDWHVPFLTFHFQPEDGIVSGSYKVRGVDTFDRPSEFSVIRSISA